MTFQFIFSFLLEAHSPPHQTPVLFQNKYFLVTDPQIQFLRRMKSIQFSSRATHCLTHDSGCWPGRPQSWSSLPSRETQKHRKRTRTLGHWESMWRLKRKDLCVWGGGVFGPDKWLKKKKKSFSVLTTVQLPVSKHWGIGSNTEQILAWFSFTCWTECTK